MSQKYQREIEEILQQAGEQESKGKSGGDGRSLPRLVWLHFLQSIRGKPWAILPGRVMLTAGALLLAAVVMSSLSPGLFAPLAWAGLLLFIIGYAMFFVRPPRVEKRWRGQTIDYGDTWWDRLRRKIR